MPVQVYTMLLLLQMVWMSYPVEVRENDSCWHIKERIDNGMIHHFDLRTNRCVNKWVDKGASLLHCIRFSPLGNYFVVGNGDGLLHLYDALRCCVVKEFSNLTTAIQEVCFHPDNQLVAFASNMGLNKVR